MGVQFDHILGHQQRAAFTAETVPGTYVFPSTADFIKVKTVAVPFKNPRSERDDSNEGLYDYEMVTEKQEVPVSIETLVFASGAAGTQGILGRLIQTVMGGTPVVSAGVSVTFPLSNTQTIPSLSMTRNFNSGASIYQEQVAGLILDEWKINAGGNEKPGFSFSGKAMSHVGGGFVFPSTETSGATITVATPGGFNFEVGSRVSVGAQTNGGAGFVVTAVTATTVVIAPAATAWVATDAVRPYAPTPSYQAGTVISHITGALTIDSVAMRATGVELSLKRNLDWIEDEFGVAGLSDAAPKKAMIEGSVTVRARRDNVIELIRRKQFTTRALNLQIGTTAGNIYEFQLPRIEPTVEALDAPQSGVGTFKFPFKAMATTNGGVDAMTVIQR